MKKKWFVISGLSVASLTIIITVAFGAMRTPFWEPGVPHGCRCTNLGDIILAGAVSPVSGNATIHSHGLETASADDPVNWSTYKITSFTNTHEHPELGTLTYQLDEDRSTVSEIRAHNPGEDFPATVRNQFHVRATDADGNVYESIDPVVFEATVTEDTWPNNNTQYEQVGTTDFRREGEIEASFTLANGSATLTQVD